jgi:hypothetical protein
LAVRRLPFQILKTLPKFHRLHLPALLVFGGSNRMMVSSARA